MVAGYSARPLRAKLGFRSDLAAVFIDCPSSLLSEIAGEDAAAVATALSQGSGRSVDHIHLFAHSAAQIMAVMPDILAALRPDGSLWLSWPKKASGVPTDITENRLREIVLPTGLVDVKVCAIDAVWSGLKFVWRRERRSSLA